MKTEYTITSADVGRTLDPPDAYMTDLQQVQAPVAEGPRKWDERRKGWSTG